MPFSELIQKYFKNMCVSKKDKLTKIFYVKGKEISPEDSQKLSELGLKDFSEIDIGSPQGKEPPEVQRIKKLGNISEKEVKKEDQPKNNKIINISFEKQNEEYKIKINNLEIHIKELE